MDNKKDRVEELVVEMIRFLQKWGLWEHTRIFASGNSYDSDDDWNGEEYKGIPLVSFKKGVNPADYVKTPSTEDATFEHIFDMTFEGPLYDIFCDGTLRTCYGKVDNDSWDYIFRHSDFLLNFIDSGICGSGEELLSNMLTECEGESAYSMWDPLKYEDFSEYISSDEYEKYNEPMWSDETDLIPAYTLFDTYEEYKIFLSGDHKMLKTNPVLWKMAVNMAKHLFYQDLEDDEFSVSGEVADHIREEFISIFNKYGLDYELIYNWMLVAIPMKDAGSNSAHPSDAQIKEAADRLKALGVSEKEIDAFEKKGSIPGVIQFANGEVKRISKKVDLRYAPLKKAFHGNIPYFVFNTKGAIPMEAYLYVEENSDEKEVIRQEAELVLSAIVFSSDDQDYEYGTIEIKLTEDGPIRVG